VLRCAGAAAAALALGRRLVPAVAVGSWIGAHAAREPPSGRVTYRHPTDMSLPVRTTLRIDDSLLEAAREHARERGETLTAGFERALRVYLARASAPEPVEAPPLPTFRGRGLQPGVDLDDNAALEDRMRDE